VIGNDGNNTSFSYQLLSDEGLRKRLKRQRFLDFSFIFFVYNIKLFSNTEFQPNEPIC